MNKKSIFRATILTTLLLGAASCLWLTSDNTPVSATSQSVPDSSEGLSDKVLYSNLFQILILLDAKAAGIEKADPTRARALRDYFKHRTNLTADEESKLKDVIAAYAGELSPIDNRALGVIMHKRKQISAPENDEARVELQALQSAKDELANRYVKVLRGTLGEDAFVRFSNFVRNDFGSNLRVKRISQFGGAR